MHIGHIPDDIVVLMFAAFRKGFRRHDTAAMHSMSKFAVFIEIGYLKFEAARAVLKNDALISDFIEETRNELKNTYNEAEEDFKKEFDSKFQQEIIDGVFLKQGNELIKRIEANGVVLGEIRTEIAQLKTTVVDLQKASDEIAGSTKDIATVTGRLTTITRALVNGVRKAVKNTSTTVGRRVGIEAGIASTFIVMAAVAVATSIPSIVQSIDLFRKPSTPPIKHEDFHICRAGEFSLSDLSKSDFSFTPRLPNRIEHGNIPNRQNVVDQAKIYKFPSSCIG